MTIKHIETDGNVIAYKVASLVEVQEPDGSWWLYYTMGADLSAKIDYYTSKGWALGDPVITGLYSAQYFGGKKTLQPWDNDIGYPVHKRPIVKPSKAANPEQALADADGENEFPRHAASLPVSYTRADDGRVWLVYQRGEHLIQVLDELWKVGKAVSNPEIICETPVTDDKGGTTWERLTHRGIQVYRRLIVPKDHPLAINPSSVPRPKTPLLNLP